MAIRVSYGTPGMAEGLLTSCSELLEFPNRRALRAELAKVRECIQRSSFFDAATQKIYLWQREFGAALRSGSVSASVAPTNDFFIAQLKEILGPCEEQAFLGSDGKIYGKTALYLFLSASPPFDFTVDPHPIVRYMVRFLQRQGQLDRLPEETLERFRLLPVLPVIPYRLSNARQHILSEPLSRPSSSSSEQEEDIAELLCGDQGSEEDSDDFTELLNARASAPAEEYEVAEVRLSNARAGSSIASSEQEEDIAELLSGDQGLEEDSDDFTELLNARASACAEEYTAAEVRISELFEGVRLHQQQVDMELTSAIALQKERDESLRKALEQEIADLTNELSLLKKEEISLKETLENNSASLSEAEKLELNLQLSANKLEQRVKEAEIEAKNSFLKKILIGVACIAASATFSFVLKTPVIITPNGTSIG